MKIGIFGCGAYGMALSSVLSENKCDITMWTKFEEEKEQLEQTRKNEKLIPNFSISDDIKITTSVEECTKGKDLLIIAIPVAFIDNLAKQMKPYINNDNIIIASKGIEQKTGLFVNQIIKKNLNTKNIGIISGPSFAIDLVSKMPIGLTLATKSKETKYITKKALQNKYVKLRSTKDIIGTEICGAIKNVIAILSGVLAGLGANESTQAMLLTESVHDIKEILDAFGANKKTVLSFAGFGDLILTCTSTKSRNYTFGKLLAQCKNEEEINDYLEKTTVEGYYTLESIYSLLKHKKVSIPTINLIYKIAIKHDDPKKILKFLVEKE